MTIEASPGVCEQFIKNAAQREHRWARIHAESADGDFSHLAAGRGRALEQQHLETGPREVDGACKPSHAGPDHRDPRGTQRQFSEIR